MGRDVQRVLLRHLRSPERASFGTGKALFLTRKGPPLTYLMLRPTFGRLRRTAGIFRPNSPLPPRLQDLRHTFAVHSIARWSQAGWSYEKMLPMLTAYMGNVREKGFLRHFELTPSRYRTQLACLDMRTRPGRQVPISFSESLGTRKKRLNFFDDVFVSKHFNS